MQTVQLKARTNKDGTLALRVPTQLGEVEMDVTVSFRPLADEPLDDQGWPVGWIERTAGSIPDLERLPQGEFEVREEW
jgi:hypothetical protein